MPLLDILPHFCYKIQRLPAAPLAYLGEIRHYWGRQVVLVSTLVASELGVPVICLTQLSRAAEERDKKTGLLREPRLSDLKETGDQEQDADMVLLLHRQPRSPDAKLVLAKNRQGEQGSFNLVFDAERMRFACNMPAVGGGFSGKDF